jgi:hypothetical protein
VFYEPSPPRREYDYSNVMLKRARNRARDDPDKSFLSNHHCHGVVLSGLGVQVPSARRSMSAHR